MSNALRKKPKKKMPKGWEQIEPLYENHKREVYSDNCFYEVFKSMQMISFTVLSDTFDFSKKRIMNFADIMKRHNVEYNEGTFTADDKEKELEKKYEFNCKKEARRFPYRAKMKMIGKAPKRKQEYTLALEYVNLAIEAYCMLAVFTLTKNYRFKKEELYLWWSEVIKVSELYIKGMDDNYVSQYLKEYCDLDIAQ